MKLVGSVRSASGLVPEGLSVPGMHKDDSPNSETQNCWCFSGPALHEMARLACESSSQELNRS